MLFNSFEFAIFFPIVFVLYWIVGKYFSLKIQNLFILSASYLFYSFWDWRFLGLIIFSTMIDYTVGLRMRKASNDSRRKAWLALSIIVNLGVLGFFKYCNFFIENFNEAFTVFGSSFHLSSLQIILPVGISFYTFQTMSYTIDIYRRKIQPSDDFIAFAGFVSFFPQLVAGPIERASHLLPQFLKKRKFEYAQGSDGLKQILWGLFKKIVIADNCARVVNIIFSNSSDLSGSTLFLGAILFALQIYGDFSGYSDIAIGSARLLGFDLKKNFDFPYFSRDIGEFWRRWHMSLSTWFRDYLYIPLGGSRVSKSKVIRNVFIIFLVSGFWHGSDWKFVIWGGLHALYFIPLLLLGKNRSNMAFRTSMSYKELLSDIIKMSMTFLIVVIAWIFFRAESVGHAFEYISAMLSSSIFTLPEFVTVQFPKKLIAFVGIMILVEWYNRNQEHGLSNFPYKRLRWVRIGFYHLLIFCILTLGGSEEEFIYFQF